MVNKNEMSARERFLCALRHEEVDRPPVWLMRQAGRYMPEYMKIKEKYDFVTMCREPEIAAEISLLPYRAFGPDAVIVFNDILIPLENMGRPILYGEDGGPRIADPVRTDSDAQSLQIPDFTSEESVAQSIRLLRQSLGNGHCILGFAGAPFTMASYTIEERMSRELTQTRRFLYEQPDVFTQVLEKITETVIRYLKIQIDAGADAVQIFDTWAGVLPPDEYMKFAHPYQKQIVDAIHAYGGHVIVFVNGSSSVLEAMAETGADCLSVDWRVRLSDVRRTLGNGIVLQGNLDPMALFAPPEVLCKKIESVISQVDPCRGYIFNLGHGILPGTPYENVRTLFREVKEKSYAAV